MFIRVCVLVLFFFINHGLSVTTTSSTTTTTTAAMSTAMSPKSLAEPKIFECAAKGGECDESKGTAVCGTDNKTYPTRCHLIRAQCSGHEVSLKYRGECNKGCIDARSYAISHTTKTNSFIPRCRFDGSYAPVQCNKDGSNCWCSDSHGNRITTNRSIVNGKLNCTKERRKKSNKRRSPIRSSNQNDNININQRQQQQPNDNTSNNNNNNNNNNNRNKRSCSRQDHAQFNSNLIKVFQTEYTRYNNNNNNQGQQNLNGQQTNTQQSLDKQILEWKFSMLDTNGNHKLDKIEYRELKKLIKKIVKPKRCARSFGKFCDIDLDGRLSRSEWINCITKDNLNLLRPKTVVETDPIIRDNDSEQGCLADRAVAEDEQKNGAEAFYVPECTADGRYQRVQCYRSVGYCWCVHEDTGKNIPGTSVKNKRPDCINNTTRPMKGCPEPKKTEFLRELKEFLKAKMPSNTNTGVNATKFTSDDEKIATLSFVLLDKNKNKLWERREWKNFRDLVTSTRGLRKCGKKMPRYCDVNNDKKITLSEWLNCLQANGNKPEQVKTSTNVTRNTSSTTKLKGQNPFETYLKSD